MLLLNGCFRVHAHIKSIGICILVTFLESIENFRLFKALAQEVAISLFLYNAVELQLPLDLVSGFTDEPVKCNQVVVITALWQYL